MQRVHHLVGCALLLAIAGTAAAKEVWEGRWIEIRSQHFVLTSALPEKQSIALALELEDFRSAVNLLTGATAAEDAIPTKIYLLPRADKALGFRGRTAAYFSASMRAKLLADLPPVSEQTVPSEAVVE